MSDELMPSPEVWAQCSECGVAYVMRRCLSLQRGYVWLWQQDCKHKRAPAVVANADGPLVDGVLP